MITYIFCDNLQRLLHSFAKQLPANDNANENSKIFEDFKGKSELLSETVSISNVFTIHSLPSNQTISDRLW